MKFIGEFIQHFTSRFRSDVYLEDISTGTIASGGNLGLDSNNKIVKAEAGPTYSDNNALGIGTSNDFTIVHDGTDTFLGNNTGDLYITQQADNKDIIFRADDGLGGNGEYFRLDGSQSDSASDYRYTRWQDRSVIAIGNGNDLQFWHNGTDSQIQNYTGNLEIRNNADDKDIVFKSDDGSGGATEYFRVDGGSEKTIYTKPISLLDSVGLQLGTGTDAQIYHTGSEGTFINYTGNFRFIQSADNADLSFHSDDGSGGTTAYLTLDGSEEQNLFTKRVRIDHDVSDASVASVGLDIDMDVSGSNALSSDITQRAIHANLASTATGGDTSDEHRLIAIQGHSRTSGAGDADDIRGVYGLAQSNRSSSATTSLLRGVHGIAYANDSASAVSTDIRGGDFSCYVDTDGPDITTMYGVLGSAYTNTNSTDNVSNVYGAFGKAESRGSGTISNAYGVLGEIEVDAGTITTGQCFRAVVDHNGGTLTTGYMYRGTTSGTVGTQWGIHLDGEDKNYFSGNVGIGITSTTSLFHVNAADGVMVDTYMARIQNSEATAGDNFGLYVQAGSNSSDVSFRVTDKDANDYFRVRGDGNVGIGTTSPGNKLEVHSGTTNVAAVFKSSDNQAWISVHDDDSGTYGALFGTDSDEGHHIVLADRSANKRLVIDADGQVGIGATTPTARLHVESVDDAVIRLKSTDNKAYIALSDNDTNGYISSENSKLSLGANVGVNANNLNIDLSNNKVGIGTSSPGEKLEVSGNIKASGTLVGKTRNVYNANFVADLGTTEYFVPLSTNVETTQAHQEEAAMLMPYDGRLVNVMFRTNSDIAHSDATLTVKLYKCAAGVNAQGGGNFAAVGTAATHTIQSGDDHHVFNFACNADNTFSHTDLVAVSIQSNVDMHNSAKFVYCTVIFEYDLNTELTTTTEYDSTP